MPLFQLAKCGSIVNQTDESVRIHDDPYPAVEGTNGSAVSPGLVLTGPNTSTCVRDGVGNQTLIHLRVT